MVICKSKPPHLWNVSHIRKEVHLLFMLSYASFYFHTTISGYKWYYQDGNTTLFPLNCVSVNLFDEFYDSSSQKLNAADTHVIITGTLLLVHVNLQLSKCWEATVAQVYWLSF